MARRIAGSETSSPTDRMMSTDDMWKAFSVAEHCALANPPDPRWEEAKEAGNEKLKAGDYLGAAKLYRDAALLAKGPLEGGAVAALVAALEEYPEESPQRMVVENEDLFLTSICGHLSIQKTREEVELKNGSMLKAEYPNKAAAVAWANRAQALLMAGVPERALRSARRATEANPEYLKGHHRVMKALEALGQRKEAVKVKKQMEEYPLVRAMYPSESQALLHCGWIEWERAQIVYSPLRFRAAAEHVAASMTSEVKRVEVRASLVPFQGGQCLMLSIVYGFHSEVQSMDYIMVDAKNAHICDRPPNGIASPKALQYAPMRIGVFIGDLAAHGLTVVAVMCGQGLTDHVTLVEERLRQGCENGMHPPYDDLIVYAAHSTAASEDAGIAFGSGSADWSGSMRAMMARLGPGEDGLGSV